MAAPVIAPRKKCQSLINAAAEQAEKIREAADALEEIRDTFTAHGVPVTGTPLEGKLAAINAWITAVRSVASDPVADAMVTAKVPSHKRVI